MWEIGEEDECGKLWGKGDRRKKIKFGEKDVEMW